MAKAWSKCKHCVTLSMILLFKSQWHLQFEAASKFVEFFRYLLRTLWAATYKIVGGSCHTPKIMSSIFYSYPIEQNKREKWHFENMSPCLFECKFLVLLYRLAIFNCSEAFPRLCSVKKMFLKYSHNLQENTCLGVSFLM